MTDTLAALIESIDARVLAKHPEITITKNQWLQLRNALPVWRPIETAPRDGTEILGYDPAEDAVLEIQFDDEDGWRITWNHQRNPDCTHWMPILPPEEP